MTSNLLLAVMLMVMLMLVLLLPMAAGYNYCNNRTHLCDLAESKHFMCKLEDLKPYGGRTKYHISIPDTQKVRKEMLGVLNTFRNMFAGGELDLPENKTFPSAKRMRVLIWDSELAYMARTHAATVSFMHSECRATVRFPMTGEILVLSPPTKHKFSLTELLGIVFGQVFEEHKTVKDPQNFPRALDSERHYRAGHFSLIVNDRMSRVGCGISVGSNCERDGEVGFCHFLTCHFDRTNVNGTFVYKTGKAATGCNDWKSTANIKYANLCENTGEIFPLISDIFKDPPAIEGPFPFTSQLVQVRSFPNCLNS
ncbi:venom allergen 5 isoform X1 [Drosophila santomea]|uniref:venom allergen 5 isoform X1 n=1 Tax=Drosophila santomea TaxID=129105 RepID=UPI001954035E|nr:venom allergen 5 isoform X1 [Drosophila santomea]